MPWPELAVVITTQNVETPHSLLPAGSRGVICHVYPADEYEVEFDAPWHVVTLRQDDLSLAEEQSEEVRKLLEQKDQS